MCPQSLGKCEVCEKEAKSRCAGCFQSFYCSKEHQKQDWPTHKTHCAPIKMCQNDKVGRFYVATRDIKPGEIVLREAPLVVGPSQATPPVCVGCFKVKFRFLYETTFVHKDLICRIIIVCKGKTRERERVQRKV